jgi:hypothetical protein
MHRKTRCQEHRSSALLSEQCGHARTLGGRGFIAPCR